MSEEQLINEDLFSEKKVKEEEKKSNLGSRIGIPFVLFLLISAIFIIYFYNRIFISIYPGQAGVLWSRFSSGTVLDTVYPEGFKIINPFNKMYIYDVRIHETSHSMAALTSNGLRINLNLSIRFKPDLEFLPLLHQKIGPDYVRKIVIPEVESVVRNVVGKYKPEELFTTKPGVLERLIFSSLTQMGEAFIVLDDVIIREIRLPPKIKKAIEDKLEQQQIMQQYEFRLITAAKEAKRKNIEAEGIRVYQDIITKSLSDKLLTWKGIEATKEISKSPNSKIIIIGSGKKGLPLILNPDK